MVGTIFLTIQNSDPLKTNLQNVRFLYHSVPDTQKWNWEWLFAKWQERAVKTPLFGTKWTKQVPKWLKWSCDPSKASEGSQHTWMFSIQIILEQLFGSHSIIVNLVRYSDNPIVIVLACNCNFVNVFRELPSSACFTATLATMPSAPVWRTTWPSSRTRTRKLQTCGHVLKKPVTSQWEKSCLLGKGLLFSPTRAFMNDVT